MSNAITAREIREGDIITFRYDGGTRTGAVRRIKVDKVSDRPFHISGYDQTLAKLSDGQHPYRTYHGDMMYDITREYNSNPKVEMMTRHGTCKIMKIGNQFFLLTRPEDHRRDLWRLEAADLSIEEAFDLLVHIYNTE
jgi:hypothetical protein